MSAPGNLGQTLARARARARSPFGFRRAALTVEFYFPPPRIFIREQGPFAAAAAVESTFDHLQFRRQKVPRSAIRPSGSTSTERRGRWPVALTIS